MKDWNPDDIKQAIDLELIGEEGKPPPTVEGVAEQKLVDAAPFAAEALVRLVMYSENEGTRFKAATYIIDKVFGKTGDGGIVKSDEKTTLEQFAGIIKVSENVSGGSDEV